MQHHWYFDGKKVHWRSAVTMGMGTSLAAISMYDTMKLTLNADPGFFDDCDKFMRIIEKNIRADNE